mmetsp:Transcript_20236/g.58046  ORF Transcript_20236/g.58046 Transcript_20236/m.58046 type:complete len:144 (-) Transcript_20236:71-502(-)
MRRSMTKERPFARVHRYALLLSRSAAGHLHRRMPTIGVGRHRPSSSSSPEQLKSLMGRSAAGRRLVGSKVEEPTLRSTSSSVVLSRWRHSDCHTQQSFSFSTSSPFYGGRSFYKEELRRRMFDHFPSQRFHHNSQRSSHTSVG